MFSLLLIIALLSATDCLLITRTAEQVQQICNEKLRLQRIDAFDGDQVKLACSCKKKLTKHESTESKVVTDQSDSLDITTWSFARELSQLDDHLHFALNLNKKWTELISKDEDAVQSESGNSNLANCAFPFFYQNKQGREITSYTCADSGREDSTCWCSTTTNYTLDRRWGFCPCAAPKRGIKLLAEFGTDPGSYCHFPFKFSGSEYHECIYEGRNRCWCGTTYDVDKDDKWGFCPCATSSIQGEWSVWGKWKSCRCGQITNRHRICISRFRNLPTGRTVVCNSGFSIETALCPCITEHNLRRKFQIADIKFAVEGLNIPFHAVLSFQGKAGIIIITQNPSEFSTQPLGWDQRIVLGKLIVNLAAIICAQRRSSVVPPERQNPTSEIILSNLTSADSGWYYCKRGELTRVRNTVESNLKILVVYELNIIEYAEVLVVLQSNKETLPYTAGEYFGDRLVWHWTKWQACDRCGVIKGEQKRFGFCNTAQREGYGVLGHLTPCRSSMMSTEKRQRMRLFHDYMEVKTCQTVCHRNKMKYIFLKMKKGVNLPTKKPPALRAIYHATKDETFRLQCPGAYPLLPVTWQFEEKTLHAALVPILRHDLRKKGSNSDRTLGMNGDLILRKIKLASAGYYSCFVNRSLSATYSIVVEEHFLQKLENLLDDTIYVVLALIALVFLSIAYHAVRLERKAAVVY